MPNTGLLKRLRLVVLRGWIFLTVLLSGTGTCVWALDVPEDIRFKRLFGGDEYTDGDNINAIVAITQDHLGFMWFGGENGLARYNGATFEIFQTDLLDPRSISGNYIWDIAQDHDGVLWVATGQGLNRFNPAQHNFTRYSTTELGEGISQDAGLGDDVLFSLAVGLDNQLYVGTSKGLWILNAARNQFVDVEPLRGQYIRTVHVDSAGVVWVGTSERGLFRWDRKQKHWLNLQKKSGQANSLPSNYVRAIAEDKDGRIWVGTLGGGLARLKDDGQTFQVYQHQPQNKKHSIGSNNIWDIHLDKDNLLWVATDPGGLSLYNSVRDDFRTFKHNAYVTSSLNSNKIRALYDDRLGDLWVGAFPSGINYFDKSTAFFHNFRGQGNDKQQLSHESVLSFLEDSLNRLWIGTESGLNLFNPASETFTHYLPDPGNPDALQAGAVLALTEDSSGDIWVGTWSGGLHRFNPTTGKFKQYKPDASNPNSLGDAFIWSLGRDAQGRVWAGTENSGLHLYVPDDDHFIRFEPDDQDPESLSFRHVWSMLSDSKQRFWVGTIDGLDLLLSVEGENARFRHFRNEPGNVHSLSSNRVVALYEDSRGYIWVGTQDAGLNRLDPRSGDVVRITSTDGMPSAYVSSIIEDNAGFIWASTVNGLALIHPDNFSVRTLSENNGLVGNNFNRDASYKDAKGHLYFGSTNGFSVFDPVHFNKPNPAPNVVITAFRLFNQPVYVDSIDSPLSDTISNTRELHLNHKHTMFAFDFYALGFRSAHRNQYSYKLEGFDQQWNLVGNKNTATYTNIDPGSYIFKVRAANSDGVWSTDGPQIKIEIAYPWWQTVWAYLLYSLVLGLAVFMVVLNQKKKLAIQQQKAINEKLLKVDHLKDAFLANTSHELRTPLNGIIGLAETMQDGSMGDVAEPIRQGLQMISSSGRRLSSLINDILDFSKLNKNTLTISTSTVALQPLVNTILELVAPLVGSKPLMLLNEVESDVYVKADDGRLQQILLNLVSNAVKFSKEGHVRIYAECKNANWAIFIEDTGAGISAQDSKKIFRAFTQLDQKETREQGGTGLGLAISQQLVELHGGQLRLESQVGVGSTFVFTLPAAEGVPESQQNLPPVSIDKGAIERLNPILSSDNDSALELLKPAKVETAYTIMIVDDDAINRMVLTSMLQLQSYSVLEAESGVDAVAMIEQGVSADLIIMDVMMPKMSGYEACMRIRVRHPVHVLPILFLTAKNFSDDLVRGFVAGGNDFLTKPISKHELLSRVSTHLTLLEVNRKLQQSLRQECTKNTHNDKELRTLEHIIEVVNRELDFNALLDATLADVRGLIDADQVIYWQADTKERTRYSVVGASDGRLQELCLSDGERVTQRLAQLYRQGQAVILAEQDQERSFGFIADTFPSSHSSVIMTVYVDEQVIGFLTLLSTNPDHCFGAGTLSLLSRVQGHVTSAILKARLLEQLDAQKFIAAGSR